MAMKIMVYPSKVLSIQGEAVTEFDVDLKRLASEMFETMYRAPGVGLAAAQVGVSKRLFVMDCSARNGSNRKVAIANPTIVYVEGIQTDEEGCLSVPGYSFKLQRPKLVIVEGQDLDGNDIRYEGVDLEARCIMHETDHCDGILYVNRLSPLKKEMFAHSVNKKIRAGDWY